MVGPAPKFAGMIDGFTQNRVSKIFSGQIGHMTVDKLIEIMSALNLKLEVKTKKSRVASQPPRAETLCISSQVVLKNHLGSSEILRI